MAVQYSETQAIQVASELTRLDLDGWTYRPEPVASQEVMVAGVRLQPHVAVVAVYDENGDFVNFLNIRFHPTESYRFCALCREQSRFNEALCDDCRQNTI